MPAWVGCDAGLRLAVRVTPRGGRDSLAVGTPDHLVARLAAAPVEGAANAALIALVAKTFGLARRDVTLVAGQTARLKRLQLNGDPQRLAELAASLYGPGA
ncbi:MAG: hypothetical protein B7Y45_03975 [Sphingomonas sp. 28-66-16]|nr:MAG: hypothetical protein B7Y45_03975 [Sphingomonas sp. 28-66-16]